MDWSMKNLICGLFDGLIGLWIFFYYFIYEFNKEIDLRIVGWSGWFVDHSVFDFGYLNNPSTSSFKGGIFEFLKKIFFKFLNV